MSGDSTTDVYCCITQYRKIILIQEIGTHTGKWYQYKGLVRIQEKQYSFEKQYKYIFQTLHNHQGKNNS